MSELPVYEYRGMNYIRLSDLPDEEGVRMEQWMSGQDRPFIAELEYQDAVYIWDYYRWLKLNDPEEQSVIQAQLESVCLSDYTPEEIEAAKVFATFSGNDTPWQLYLP